MKKPPQGEAASSRKELQLLVEQRKCPQRTTRRHMREIWIGCFEDIHAADSAGDSDELFSVMLPRDRLSDNSGRSLELPDITPKSGHCIAPQRMSALCQRRTHAVQRRCDLKIGYQACVDQHAIEAARFGSISAAV